MRIILNDESFRYDVHSIVKAFYPEDKPDFNIVCENNISEPIVRFSEGLTVYVPEYYGERTSFKSRLKRLIYDELSRETGKQLPWGTLTGIRPVKIPVKLLLEGRDREYINDYMREVYYASHEKINLATDIAQRQLKLLRGADEEDCVSLYIGIPFCPSICAYCSFSSYPYSGYRDRAEAYITALEREMDAVAKSLSKRRIISIYVGGGTPSSLEEPLFERLISNINSKFNLSHLREFTVECGRPDSITPEKLRILKVGGVDRICINPQTMNDKTLRLIGRAHTEADMESAFYMAREAGFDHINTDLIAGLPGEGIDEISHTLSRIEKLSPDSLTVHVLALKRASRINLEWEGVKFGDVGSPVMDRFSDTAAKLNMKPYYLYRQKQIAGNLENTGYATEGSECLYNILIMGEFHDIIALGAGSISKFLDGDKKPVRTANVKDVDLYINNINEMIERKAAWL